MRSCMKVMYSLCCYKSIFSQENLSQTHINKKLNIEIQADLVFAWVMEEKFEVMIKIFTGNKYGETEISTSISVKQTIFIF